MNSCGQSLLGKSNALIIFGKFVKHFFSLAFAKDTDIRQIKLKTLWKLDREKLVPEKIKWLPGNYNSYWMYIKLSIVGFYYIHCIIYPLFHLFLLHIDGSCENYTKNCRMDCYDVYPSLIIKWNGCWKIRRWVKEMVTVRHFIFKVNTTILWSSSYWHKFEW